MGPFGRESVVVHDGAADVGDEIRAVVLGPGLEERKGVAEVTRVPLELRDHVASGNVVVGPYQVA